MQHFILSGFLVLNFSLAVVAQTKPAAQESIAEVNFCDLIENPNSYAGKTIRVKATFESAAGVSKMFCSDCLDVQASWVKFGDGFEKNTKKAFRKRLKEKAISNVIFVGKFSTGEFGKNREYASQFAVETAENVEVLADKPGNLTVRMQAKTYCQKND